MTNNIKELIVEEVPEKEFTKEELLQAVFVSIIGTMFLMGACIGW